MSIENDEVRKIARLARLRIEEEDIERYASELAKILTFVDQMSAVDTRGVEPMAHPLDATQRLRPDVVTEPDGREAFQALAPSTERGLYLVPKVIE